MANDVSIRLFRTQYLGSWTDIGFIGLFMRLSRRDWSKGIKGIVLPRNFFLWLMILDLIRINRCLLQAPSSKLVILSPRPGYVLGYRLI